MPRKPKPKPPQRRNMPRVNLTLDIETLNKLAKLQEAHGFLDSMSATVRWLAAQVDLAPEKKS